uniref:Uncharacterized protein n=1 Tax=Anguilla anguilla TaxID=7936 RepID=A0A0E9P805_ANGAN
MGTCVEGEESSSPFRMAANPYPEWTGEYLCLICWNQKYIHMKCSPSPAEGGLSSLGMWIEPGWSVTWPQRCSLIYLEWRFRSLTDSLCGT